MLDLFDDKCTVIEPISIKRVIHMAKTILNRFLGQYVLLVMVLTIHYHLMKEITILNPTLGVNSGWETVLQDTLGLNSNPCPAIPTRSKV